MKKYIFIFISIYLLVLVACGNPKKETGIPIYIEVEQLDPQIVKCFNEKLYGKWASLDDLKLHDKNEKYTGSDPSSKHIFKSYDDFDASKDTAGTEKIMVRMYGDGTGDTATTFFQIRRYELEPEGIWTQTMNLGNFRMQDRPNDQINPGKVDEDEACDLLVKFCIKASFK